MEILFVLVVLGFMVYVMMPSSNNQNNQKQIKITTSNEIIPGLDMNWFSKKDYFFTKSEKTFFYQLINVINQKSPGRYVVFSKVRVSDLLSIPTSSPKFKKISPWHIDFVLVDSFLDFKPVLAIELDWESHSEEKQFSRDKLKNTIFDHIGLPLIRFWVWVNHETIKNQIINRLA